MLTLIRYVLLTAMRDRLFAGLWVLLVLVYGLALFIGNTALSEQAAMAVSLFAGASRMLLVAGLTVFACFHVQRAFDYKEIDAILAKPLSRSEFIGGYAGGFALLAGVMLIPVVCLCLTFSQTWTHMTGLAVWTGSLFLEVVTVVMFSLLTALMIRSAFASVLATLGFYIIGRLIGFFLAAMHNPASMIGNGDRWQEVLLWILKILSTVIPRLDLFAKSQWLLYGVPMLSDLWLFLLQAVVFIGLLLSMAVYDLKRKQF